MTRYIKIQTALLVASITILLWAVMTRSAPAPLPKALTSRSLRGTAWRYTIIEGPYLGVSRRTDYVLRLRGDGSCDGGEAPGYSPLDEPLSPPGPFQPRWNGRWYYVGGYLFVTGHYPGNTNFEEVFRLDATSTVVVLKVSDRAVNGVRCQAPTEMRVFRVRPQATGEVVNDLASTTFDK